MYQWIDEKQNYRFDFYANSQLQQSKLWRLSLNFQFVYKKITYLNKKIEHTRQKIRKKWKKKFKILSFKYFFAAFQYNWIFTPKMRRNILPWNISFLWCIWHYELFEFSRLKLWYLSIWIHFFLFILAPKFLLLY